MRYAWAFGAVGIGAVAIAAVVIAARAKAPASVIVQAPPSPPAPQGADGGRTGARNDSTSGARPTGMTIR